MQMSDVIALCASLCIHAEPGPLGVLFSWYFDRGNVERTGRVYFRIERGSGIAGRGDAWNVRELPTGEPLGPKVTSPRQLRRQILGAIAEGPRPAAQPGYEVYARWHTYGPTSSVQWFTRRKASHVRQRPAATGRRRGR